MVGTFNTFSLTELNIKLPELNRTAMITAECHVTNAKSNYDLTFGTDLLRELGINLNFKNNTISWQDIFIPMKPVDCLKKVDYPDRKQLKKGEYIAFNYHSTSGETTSATYEVQISYFGSGLPEEWIVFTGQLSKGIHGQDITTGPGRFDYTLRLLTGNAKATFEHKARDITPHKVANFDTALKAMMKHIIPTHVYREQKRHLCRYLKKPTDMKVRKLVTRVVEINRFFAHFPSETGENCESLHEDEVKRS